MSAAYGSARSNDVATIRVTNLWSCLTSLAILKARLFLATRVFSNPMTNGCSCRPSNASNGFHRPINPAPSLAVNSPMKTLPARSLRNTPTSGCSMNLAIYSSASLSNEDRVTRTPATRGWLRGTTRKSIESCVSIISISTVITSRRCRSTITGSTRTGSGDPTS